MAELRRLNGTPREVLEHEELMEIMLPVLRADFALYETYVYSPEPPLNCPISAFGGLQDRKVSHSDLEAWRDQTSASFSLQNVSRRPLFPEHNSAVSFFRCSPRNCADAGENSPHEDSRPPPLVLLRGAFPAKH